MSAADLQAAREIGARLIASLYDYDAEASAALLRETFAPDAAIKLAHPLTTGRDGVREGADGFITRALGPLAQAMPDMERRTLITVTSETDEGHVWIGHGGNYTGTFTAPFLDIPATGHIAHLRFHEFFRVVEGRVVEMQAIWDIPELMMQAGCWPLSPSLGREMHVPAPATQDGLVTDRGDGAAACAHVIDMLTALTRYPREPVEAMELERFWHPKMMWYGPSGIGSGRGVLGFRNWHQAPFVAAQPDRGQYPDRIEPHFFGEGDYVAVTGWPDMHQTLDGSGWLGLPPTGKRIDMRSLDFWRLEGGLIRENWVLVDLLHMYDQIGVDVLARMRELTKTRPRTTVPLRDPSEG